MKYPAPQKNYSPGIKTMARTAAYLRRSLALLDWIDTRHPEANVTMGPAELGRWAEIMPRWHLQGHRIHLQLHRWDRSSVFLISAVHPAPWGAAIKIWDCSRLSEDIQVIWRQPAAQAKTSRCKMRQAARAWLQEKLPGCRIVSESQAPDRVHTLSGSYLRIRLVHGETTHLLLACAVGGEIEKAHAILTQALLWLGCLEDQRFVSGRTQIHLLVPAGHAAVLCHRSGLINLDRTRVEVWEYVEGPSQEWVTRHPAPAAVPLEDRDFHWPVLGPFRWSRLLGRVVELAPEIIQRYPRFQDYDSLRIWGLEFARVYGPERDRLYYGVGSQQVELNEDNFDDLRSLVEEIACYRRPDSPAPNHPYYRMQSERWLESLILENVALLFPELIPGSVYPQIPVYLGQVSARVDILGVDRGGNLVVMELKVSEDPDLPLQSLDYWGRVIAHNLSGDFEKRGYFAGLHVSRARPKIYLVAPIFCFHDSLERVMRYLDPSLEITKIGINEDWRCGVKILRRLSYRCADIR